MKGNVFIKRPVMAISISVLILAIGLISLFTLPVEQYPDIAPPTVYVTASYTGADAEAVMNSVIMPLEESINGVEDMMYISSSASNAGLAIIQVYFKQGTDPDMAAVNVQNRVAKAQGLLPAEVTKVGVSTMKRAPFGPISPYNCPFSIVMLNPSTARSPPKEIPRFFTSNNAILCCLLFCWLFEFCCDTLSHLNTFWCPVEKHHYDQNDGIDQHTIILQSTEHLRKQC